MNKDLAIVGFEKEGNTKLSKRGYKYWCFTYNNYKVGSADYLIKVFEEKGWTGIIEEEIGKKGTPHLQGFIQCKNQVRLNTLKNLEPSIHWEPCIGNQDQNKNYCSKDGTVLWNTIPKTLKEKILEKSYKNVLWKNWQNEILTICRSEPDDRKVRVYVDVDGNKGKSYLAKYLALTYDIILVDGKKNDIFNQVKTWMDNHPESSPKIVIADIPRTNLEYINWGVIESVKNGLLYSGKFEGGQCIFECPHVIVFMNEFPDTKELSQDRWIIREIRGDIAWECPSGNHTGKNGCGIKNCS